MRLAASFEALEPDRDRERGPPADHHRNGHRDEVAIRIWRSTSEAAAFTSLSPCERKSRPPVHRERDHNAAARRAAAGDPRCGGRPRQRGLRARQERRRELDGGSSRRRPGGTGDRGVREPLRAHERAAQVLSGLPSRAEAGRLLLEPRDASPAGRAGRSRDRRGGWGRRRGRGRPSPCATTAPNIRISRNRSERSAARRCLGHRVAEAVADAAHGEDVRRLARVGLDLLAQVADVDVDRARLAVGRVAPDRLEQRLAAVDAAGVAARACAAPRTRRRSAEPARRRP